MDFLNTVLRGLFDALLFPFRTLPPIVGLVVVSLLTSVLMLLIFKRTSNQTAVEQVKRKIHAGLFEIRLFNDDFRAILRAQWDIVRHNLGYIKLSLVPMLFMLPPVVLMIAQLQFHYGYAPLKAGDRAIVDVELAEGWDQGGAVPVSDRSGKPQVELQVPSGVTIETPAVWSAADRTLSWRLRVDQPGNHALQVVVGDQTFDKMLTDDGGRIVRRSPLRPGGSLLDKLLYPAEPGLPGDSPVASIALDLREAAMPVAGGWSVDTTLGMPGWMAIFFVLSIVFAFALRKPLGVEL
jgi:uncharacterized membrane protein (DUF106 family)